LKNTNESHGAGGFGCPLLFLCFALLDDFSGGTEGKKQDSHLPLAASVGATDARNGYSHQKMVSIYFIVLFSF
jgi:hypothetical protein